MLRTIEPLFDLRMNGANFVVADKPTGDSNNSPNTSRKIENTTQSGLTNVSSGVKTIAAIITKNEIPAKNKDKANFFGVDGPRSANFVHINANIGARTIINNGLNDWNHAVEVHNPKALNLFVYQ